MIDKSKSSLSEVLSQIKDGATILIGGFGTAGQPAELIDGLIELGVKDLTIVSNNAGNGDYGLLTAQSGSIKKVICSFPRQSDSYVLMNCTVPERLNLNWYPRNLACRIQAAVWAWGGVYPNGFGTLLAEGKETRHIDGKDTCLSIHQG
ncbi:3-oxoacid CoA-transferase, A subunit [Acinetobacter baumannii WC-692]|nr:3-oxoacid CoA-transferase, A subunit [Acinetobacter baumannii WC-692]